MATEPDVRRIVLQDARAVLGPASEAAQQQCVASLAGLLQGLMAAQIIDDADPHALARLINGSLADAAGWIADAPAGAPRLEQALHALDLLLRGVRRL
ncbi:hypothetical protein G6F66_015453 [Rhizopus arrhizus]|nr:hypothetical protein G6F66_015453 [Rhizopus arrhizus]